MKTRALILLLLGLLVSNGYAAAPCIKHTFVSGIADSGDASVVRPSNWNECHTIEDAAVGANKLASAVNAQTGTSYTVLNSDRGKLVTLTNASAVAVSLPQAGFGSAFIDGWFADFQNRGAGTVTITPATSTIDGGASVALLQNQGIRIFSNGTNYFTQRGLSGNDGLGQTTDLTGLTADTSPTGDDLVYTVNDPGGTPAKRKVTLQDAVKGGLPSGCTDGQVVEYDTTSSLWICGDNDGITDHGALTGLNDNDHSAVYCLFTVSTSAPGAGAVASACHIWIDDDETPKRIYYGEGVGNNFEEFGALGDAHNAQVVGTVTVAASGSEDLRHLDVLGLTSAKLAYNGTTTFTNQPTNDGIEALSSNAGDTTQTLTAYCTLNGGDASLAHIVTIALNGTTFVASTETNLQDCWAFVLSATTTGNITIREASGNATIATITAGATSAADLDIVLTRRDFTSITLNIDRDTALADTDDRSDFWINTLGRTLTIHQIKGWTDTGTSTINIQRDDGSAADICTSNLVASTSGVTCTLSATEKLISDGHKLDFVMVTAATSGTPTKVTVNIKGY